MNVPGLYQTHLSSFPRLGRRLLESCFFRTLLAAMFSLFEVVLALVTLAF